MTTFMVPSQLAIPLHDEMSLSAADVEEIDRLVIQLREYFYNDGTFGGSVDETSLCRNAGLFCEHLARHHPLMHIETAARFMGRIRTADTVSMSEAWLFCLFTLCFAREHTYPFQSLARLSAIIRHMPTAGQNLISPESVLDQPVKYPD